MRHVVAILPRVLPAFCSQRLILVLGQVLMFGDRLFYRDWWNANTIEAYWRLWNLPVHYWMVSYGTFSRNEGEGIIRTVVLFWRQGRRLPSQASRQIRSWKNKIHFTRDNSHAQNADGGYGLSAMITSREQSRKKAAQTRPPPLLRTACFIHHRNLWPRPRTLQVRHVYFPCLRAGLSKDVASGLCFLLSAVLHELLVSVPFHMVREIHTHVHGDVEIKRVGDARVVVRCGGSRSSHAGPCFDSSEGWMFIG